MPLNPQEERAIRLILPTLDTLWGKSWSLRLDCATLDELHPSKPTPECIISNELMTAAPEVKRLFGDASTRDYSESQRSLYRRLVPPYGGRYLLWPPAGVGRPLSKELLRWLRKEIQRVGDMPIGGKDIVRIRRTGEMQCLSEDRGQFVNCWHVNRTDEVVREIQPHVTGIYYFNDDSPDPRWNHSFISDRARQEFQSALIDACTRSTKGHPVRVDWYEEWKLERSHGENGVFVAGMVVGWMLPGVQEEVQRALDAAAAKFHERWADHHVVVLERIGHSWATLDHVKEVWPRLNLPENVDLILLVDGELVSQLFLRERAASLSTPLAPGSL